MNKDQNTAGEIHEKPETLNEENRGHDDSGNPECSLREELRKCEERFMKAFLASPDGVAFSRLRDSRIKDANDVLVKMLRFRRDELIDKSALDLGIWPNAEERMRYIHYLNEQGGVTDLAMTFRRKDGSDVPALISGQIVEFQGEPYIVTFIRDISDRKVAEEALQTSEAHYKATLDSLSDAIHVVDKDMKILLFNTTFIQWCKALDIDTENLTGMKISDAFSFLPAYVFEAGEKVFRTGESSISEQTMTVKGVEKTTEVRRTPLAHADKIVRLVTVIRDITDRRKQERDLKESEMKYRTLTNNIPDIICSIDGSGRLMAINETSMQLTGYDIQEVVESAFIDFIHPGDRALVIDNFKQGIVEKREYTRGLQFRLLKKSGEVIWVELNSHRRFDENGRFLQEDAILRDITERKRAEEERAILARRLEERTSELSAANAELSRAVRAKDEFLASMSHELRTPLSSILSISESLDEEVYGTLTERQRKPVKNITESGQHLLSLINDILDLSKIEAGKITLELAPVNVEDLCQASMRLARSQAFKKKLSVSLTVDSQVTRVRADERYLKQILVNLLGNAVKFTPEGGSMGLEVKGDTEEQKVCFTVWDKGIGIPPEKHSLLFRPFTQLDSSLSRQYGGTGLGLALVSRLTEMHGGSVSLESAEGEGSRFTVSLPWNPHLHQAEEESCDEMLTEDSMDEPPSSIRKILVVEDSQGDAEQIARYLRELGVNPVIQKEGRNAVEKALEIKPDMIILDIMLPDIDGWEVLKSLKSDPRTQSIPVSMASVIDERSAGREMGADEYIVKPVSREQLKKVLGSVLKARETEAAAMAAAPAQRQGEGIAEPGGPLVLLADDNENTISILSEYLYVHGFKVIVARNGREACDRARESHPDMVLMDIQMPGVDGLEAIGILRRDSDRAVSAVPIIALTALAMVGDRERCIQAGADEYMSKPVSLRKLVKTIEHMLLMRKPR